MTVVEICCPNCGSPSIKKDGTDYCCNNCGRLFQIVNKTSRREPKSKVVVNQQIKYGKVAFNPESVKKLEDFNATHLEVIFNFTQIFKFHVFKQKRRYHC
jgi:Uncharacterized Zn-finger containing protein